MALALFVCILPIDGTIALRNLAFLALVAITLWQAAYKRTRFDFPLFGAWMLYAGVAGMSLLYAVDPGYSLHEIRVEIINCMLIMMIAASWIRDEPQFRRIVWLLLAGNLLFVAGSFWAWWHDDILDGAGSGSWATGVGDTATTIVATLPWLVMLALRWFAQGRTNGAAMIALLVVANLFAMFLTMNRQGWVALAAAFAVMILLSGREFRAGRRMIALVSMVAIMIAVIATLLHIRFFGGIDQVADSVEQSALVVERDARWDLWEFSFQRIDDRPWSGGGFGREAFKLQFPEYYRAHDYLWHAHNMVINKGIQMGLPGLAAFLLLWLALARVSVDGLRVPALRPWTIAFLSMMAGVFMRNMTDDFFYRNHALMFWLIAGAFLGTLRQAQQNPARVAASEAPRLLVIRRDNIGDLLCTTPLLAALRQAWPNGWIGALANRYNAPILEHNPDLDAVFAYEKAKHRSAGKGRLAVWLETARLLWRLRRMKLDMVLCASPGARRFARLLAPRCIVEADRAVGGHEVEITARLLAQLEIAVAPGPMVLRADPNRQRQIRQTLRWPEDGHEHVVALHLSARKPQQRWPLENFQQLIQRLLVDGLADRVLVFWAPGAAHDPQHPGDDDKAEQLLEALDGLPVLPVPTHELPDLVAGLSLANTVICSDGGAMHIAAALGKPIVCFFGNSSAERWHPWGVPYALLQKPSRDVADIAVDETLAAFQRLTGRLGKQ